MKSNFCLAVSTKNSLPGILLFFYLFLNASSVFSQPITVVIQTPDGVREVCQGTSTFVLTAYAEGGNQDFVSYEWTAAADMLTPFGDYAIFNNSFTATPGEYFITVTVFDSDGNSGTGNITITLKETPTVSITAEGPTTFCFGESVNLIASPTNGFQYTWRRGTQDIPGATQPVYTATESGNYRVRITSVNECFSLSDIIPVTVHPLPEVVASNDGPVCEGEDLQLLGSPDGMVSYSWSGTGFTSNLQNPVISNISPSQAGTYTLTATDSNSCQNSASTQVVVNPLPAAPVSANSSLTHICAGSEGFITLTATGGSGQILRWYQGSCGGTEIGSGNNLVIPFPSTTTTFFVLWESDFCGQSACASVTVNVTQPPDISITSTPISCDGENDATATVNISGGTPPYSILWSTGETTPTISNLGSGTYSVTVTDAAGCIVSQEVTIIEPDPLLLSIINEVNPVCSGEANGQATVQITGGTPPFSLLWSNGQTTPTATGLSAGTYQVTVTDHAGCTESESVTLTDPPPIQIQVVSITHVECHGDETGAVTVAALNGTEPYTYLWSNGASGPSLVNVAAGTYVVTATDANNCQETASIEITQPDPIEVSAGEDQTICAGQSATLTASGADTYLWSTGETTATIVVSPLVTTTYTVTGYNDCGLGTAEVTVFVEDGPVVDLGDDIEICAGEEVTLDAGFFENVTYLWSTGQTTQTIVVSTPGIYSVTVSSTINECSSTDQIEVIHLPVPPAETGSDRTICLGDEIILGSENPVPSPTSSYFWTSAPPDPSLTQPNVSNPTVSPQVTTVYTLVETYLDTGCENTNSVTITVVGEAPDPGEDQTICQGQSVTLGPATPNPGSTYYWTSSNPEEIFNNQVPNPVVTPQITTIYTIHEVVGECIFTASVAITVNPSPTADAGTDKEICFGESVVIGPEDFEPSPASTFLWTSVPPDPSISDPNSSNPTVSPLVTTVYTLTETFTATGCSMQNSITVTVNELPEIRVADDATICRGESVFIGHPEASASYSYAWTSDPPGFVSNERNPQVSPQVTTTYFVTATTNAGCKASDMVTITVNPSPEPNISDNIVFCTEDEVEPVYIGGEAIAGYVYSWTSDPPGFLSNQANPLVTFSGTSPITYILNVTNEFACSANFTVTISLSDLKITVSEPSVCADEESLFLGSFISVTGGSPPYIYRWFDSQGTQIGTGPGFIAVAPLGQKYEVEVTDAAGCTRNQNINVTIFPTPEVQLTVSPSGTAFIGQTITFTALPSGYPNYEFLVDGVSVQSGSSNIFSSNQLQNGQLVSVVVTSADGCTGMAEPFGVLISGLPNAFTPDGDGINDIFGQGYDLVIFNRWGQMVYQGTEGWDGKHNGRDVSPGTYYYILEITEGTNEKTVLKGSVTVIRHRR